MSLNKDELNSFLDNTRMGVVATIRKDGSPQATPVWYQYDGEIVTFWDREYCSVPDH